MKAVPDFPETGAKSLKMVSSFGECGTIFFEPVLSAAKVIVRQAHDSQSKRRCNNLHLYNDVKNFWYLLHRRRTCDGGCASVRERSFCEICHDDFLKVSDPRKVSSCRAVRSFVANVTISLRGLQFVLFGRMSDRPGDGGVYLENEKSTMHVVSPGPETTA